MIQKLTVGLDVELYRKTRRDGKTCKWKRGDAYVILSITKRDIILQHKRGGYRETIPIWDLRAASVALAVDGKLLRFAQPPNWKEQLDKTDQVNASRLCAEYFPEEHVKKQVTEDEEMMKRADIMSQLSLGRTIDDLVDMYRPSYPEMSERMLKTKIISLSKVYEPKKVHDGTSADGTPEVKKSARGRRMKAVPTVAPAATATCYTDEPDGRIDEKEPDNDDHGVAEVLDGNGLQESVQDVAAIAPVQPDVPFETMMIRNQAGDHPVEAAKPTFYIVHNGHSAATASFIKALAETIGYIDAKERYAEDIDVCILMLPVSPLGTFELGLMQHRIRSYMLYLVSSVDAEMIDLIRKAVDSKDCTTFDDGPTFVEQLRFIGGKDHTLNGR